MMTKVKICGISNLEDAFVAAQAGADLLGFIFYKPSPRFVPPALVQEIVSKLRAQMSAESQLTPPLFVGVFVNASLDAVSRTLDDCQLDAAQLHGDEPPEMLGQLNGRAYNALRPQSPGEAEMLIQKYLPSTPLPYASLPLPYFLLDAYHPARYGGTGQVADWNMAAAIARRYPTMLAGSLTPDNVAGAIRAVKPWGVDVSSGVEVVRGKKDHQKVRQFIQVAKGVEGCVPHLPSKP